MALCNHSPSLNSHFHYCDPHWNASRLRNISITTTNMKYVLFFPPLSIQSENIVNGKNGPEFCVLAQRQVCVKETTDISKWLQNSAFSQKRRKYLLYLFPPSSTRLMSNEKQICLLCQCWWPWRQK